MFYINEFESPIRPNPVQSFKMTWTMPYETREAAELALQKECAPYGHTGENGELGHWFARNDGDPVVRQFKIGHPYEDTKVTPQPR